MDGGAGGTVGDGEPVGVVVGEADGVGDAVLGPGVGLAGGVGEGD